MAVKMVVWLGHPLAVCLAALLVALWVLGRAVWLVFALERRTVD